MAPYASQLEYIRQRALPQSDLKLAENLTTFYAAYAGILTQTCIKYRLDSTEVQQYEAEKRLFKIIWPNEFFPGQPPYRKYILQLHNIQRKALDAGIPPETFDQVCKQLARARYEDDEEDFDLKQYRTEEWLWGHFWPNDVFPGVDPSVPPPPPPNPTRSIPMLIEPQVTATATGLSQEKFPPSSQPTTINAKASSGQPGPIAAPTQHNSSAPSSSGSIYPAFHAAPNTFLHSILHNGCLPAPLSTVLRCTARTEVNSSKGGLDVWIQCENEGAAVVERAHVLVGNWAEMSVDEGWAQMVRVLSDCGRRADGGGNGD